MRVTQRGACRPRSSCNFHLQPRSSAPSLVDRVFGQMFVGYAGLPSVSTDAMPTHMKRVKLLIPRLNIGFRLILLGPRSCVSNQRIKLR